MVNDQQYTNRPHKLAKIAQSMRALMVNVIDGGVLHKTLSSTHPYTTPSSHHYLTTKVNTTVPGNRIDQHSPSSIFCSQMEDIFEKIEQDLTKFNLGDEEVCLKSPLSRSNLLY
jgi:hypothetical protein